MRFKDKEYANKLYIRTIIQVLDYGRFLPVAEWDALLFILNRTLKYHRTDEYIPYKHWFKGVFEVENKDKEGILLHHPVSMSKPTLIKACEGLVNRGFITINLQRRKEDSIPTNCYEVKHTRILEVLEEMALNISKKHKAQWEQKGVMRNDCGVKDRTKVGKGSYQGGVKDRTSTIYREDIRRKDIRIKTFPGSENPGMELESNTKAQDSVYGALKEAKEKHISALQKNVEKMEKTPTQKGISSIWKLSYMKHYEGRTITDDFNKKSFYKFTAGFNAHHLPVDMGIIEFIDWVIENWSTFPSCEFSWFKSGTFPGIPSFSFFAKMYKYFVRAYGDLDERGVIHGHRIELAANKAKNSEEVRTTVNENRDLKAEIKKLKNNEKHLTGVIMERGKRKPRKKAVAKMVPVDELDFNSIEPLPAFV